MNGKFFFELISTFVKYKFKTKTMKKLMMIMVAATMLLASCSKESRLNRKLDGTWNLTSYTVNGFNVPLTGVSMSVVFVKDKKGVGSYTLTYTFTGLGSQVETGTYSLTDDTKITLTKVTPTPSVGETPNNTTITSYSKTDLTTSSITSDGDLEVRVFKKAD